MNRARAWGAGLATLGVVSCHDFGYHAPYAPPAEPGGAAGSGWDDQGGHGGDDDGTGGSEKAAGGSTGTLNGNKAGNQGSAGRSQTSGNGGALSTGGTHSSEAGRNGTPGSGGPGEGGAPNGGSRSGEANEGGMNEGGQNANPGIGGTMSSGGGVSGGDAGQAGALGEPPWPVPVFCSDYQSVVPACSTEPLKAPPIVGLENAWEIAITTQNQWGGWHVIVSERNDHTVKINWGDDSINIGWACFDTVPHGHRVAGTSLTNDAPEWYVTTQCGELFARRLVPYRGNGAWAAWAPLSLPTSNSYLIDVATSVSPEGINYLFTIDRGHVYGRHRTGADTASYGAWEKVQSPISRGLAAGLRVDGRQQLFLLDEVGDPFTCIQTSPDLGAAFGSCVDFDAADVPELIDIAAPYRVPEGSPVLALDIGGDLWVRFQDDDLGYYGWQRFPVAVPEALVSITGAGVPNRPDAPFRIAGVTRGGSVYMIVRRQGLWGNWEVVL